MVDVPLPKLPGMSFTDPRVRSPACSVTKTRMNFGSGTFRRGLACVAV
jgi:hypothetical protein